jgi:hypothetical protein
MSDLIFSKRMKLEKEYLAWIAKNNLENCASNMIAFLDGKKKLIHDLTALPTYYLLRRTVGGASGRYEYFHDIGEWWLNPVGVRLFDTPDAAARTRNLEMCPGAEIVPIKLLLAPNSTTTRQVASNPTIEGF